MKKHINIPVFIPHLGCPNSCVFCNQRTISGVSSFDPNSVVDIIEASLATIGGDTEAELAFFGGSFTGIDRDLMIYLLEISKKYLDSGKITSVRCSTRPDYINRDILEVLKRYGVKTIELGLQSASDSVLSACERGHTFEHEQIAVQLIRSYGFRLGGQMMIGLPGATLDDEIETAKFIANSGCDEARIYPTVVFRDTALCDMTLKNAYTPLAIEDAINRSASAFEILVDANVKILRIGLCDSENLHNENTYYAGPNHPAMGELVENEYYRRLTCRKLADYDVRGKILRVSVPIGHTSKFIGHKKRNKNRILQESGAAKLIVEENNELSGYTMLLKIEERK